MKLLLISNSYSYGRGFLDHCIDEIRDFIGTRKEILFIPYALHDHNNYSQIMSNRFSKIGCDVISIHRLQNVQEAINQAQIFFVGGGNTFRLLKSLYDNKILDLMRERITNGIPYIGISAGANIASPTIKTTNDMPIVYPPRLESLNLIPFQINPHYFEPDPNSKIMLESRSSRIKEFHEENDSYVLGLREGSYLRIENENILLKGESGVILFVKDKEPKEYIPITNMSFLLN